MTLPFALSPEAAVFMAVVIFVAAFLRGYSGFGYPVLVIAAGALVMNPLYLVPAAVMGDLVLGAQHWRASRAHVDWATVRRLALGALLGLIPGLWILLLIDESTARIMVSVMVLLACVVMLGGWTVPGHAGPAATLGMGVVSGLSAAAGVAGPPAVMLVAALGLAPLVFRATLLAYFMLLDTMVVIQFTLAGRVDHQGLTLAALSVPLVILGSWLGARRVMHTDPKRFRQVTIAMLALMAVIGLIKVWL
ncbi:MAG: sulfite exporter TauE/SafE family protein [Rhodobacter sp.]|nr:sulfite exporter TauE/SafE family protein [Paracoccaceae bacterium]MCC0076110.1 sulfite exporter TauE/SafE family protein [Rhodobacter sp.]